MSFLPILYAGFSLSDLNGLTNRRLARRPCDGTKGEAKFGPALGLMIEYDHSS